MMTDIRSKQLIEFFTKFINCFSSVSSSFVFWEESSSSEETESSSHGVTFPVTISMTKTLYQKCC